LPSQAAGNTDRKAPKPSRAQPPALAGGSNENKNPGHGYRPSRYAHRRRNQTRRRHHHLLLEPEADDLKADWQAGAVFRVVWRREVGGSQDYR
jgi:hypothetical protein